MDAVTATADMTAREFLALTLRPEGQIRRELIDGEIVVSEASWTHNESQVTVLFALGTWVRGAPRRGSAGLPLDVLLDERSQPDAPRFDVSLELGSGDSLESPLLPGFSLPVGGIFAA